MRILFIYPNPHNSSPPSGLVKILSVFFNFPISTFEALENVTPKEHSVDVVNELNEPIDFEDDYDIIGISAMTNQAPRAYSIADDFRKRGKKVVLGGWHPSALPDEAKQHADSVVIGEAEELWPKLLKDAEKGKMKKIYSQKKPVDISAIPFRENGKSRKRGYTAAKAIEATRGCPNGCNFCAITNSPGRRIFRTKPIERVIEEIQSISQKYLLFMDASMTINPKYTKQLFKQMKDLNKKFYSYGNANILLKDEELLKTAQEAGCVSWTIGFDSISQKSLQAIGKRTNITEEYNAVIKKIHDFGMNVDGSFMFGFDPDTPDIFDNTLDFVCSSELNKAEFHILTPFPGTPLYKILDKQNRILTKDWSKYDSKNVIFKPKNMTANELINGVKKMYEGYYNPSNILNIIGSNVKKGFFPLFSSISLSFQGFQYSRKN